MATINWTLGVSLLVCFFVMITGATEPQCSPFHYHEQLLERMVDVKYKMDEQTKKMEKWEKLMTEKLEHLEQILNENRKLDTKLTEMVENQQSIVNTTIADLKKESETLKQSIADEVKTQVVFFKARNVKNKSPSNGDKVVFQTVTQNEGSGYKSDTGVFTAPVSGTYMFTVQFCLQGGNYMAVNIVANDAVITAARFGDKDYSGMCTMTDGVATVKSGQEVQVQVVYRSNTPIIASDHSSQYWSYVSGVLMHT